MRTLLQEFDLSESDRARMGQLLFSTAVEGLVVVDEEGWIRMSNPRLDEMFGYAKGELAGRKVEELLPRSAVDRQVAHHTRHKAGRMQRSNRNGMDLMGRRKDGSIFPLEVSLNHFSVAGVRYTVGLVSDITLRRNAELELKRSHEELEQRVEERTAELRQAEHDLREALDKEHELHTLKSRFVSMASHEFRTPLSTIMSSVDLIARYGDSGEWDRDKMGKHITRIRTKVRELTTMLDEFLSLERIDQGHMEPVPVEIDLVHLCVEMIEDLRGLAKAGQTIEYGHTGDRRNVLLDRQMLAHIISNLVTNGIKYSPEGSTIDLRTSIEPGRLVVVVADRGIGIPKEDQHHLFERFFRGSNATTVQGTGLGLSIVGRYVELMGGTIRFTSEPGNTVFTIELPQPTTL